MTTFKPGQLVKFEHEWFKDHFDEIGLVVGIINSKIYDENKVYKIMWFGNSTNFLKDSNNKRLSLIHEIYLKLYK